MRDTVDEMRRILADVLTVDTVAEQLWLAGLVTFLAVLGALVLADGTESGEGPIDTYTDRG